VDIFQRRKILDREPHAVEKGDLGRAAPARTLTGNNSPKLGRGIVLGHLLDLTLDPGLRQILDEGAGTLQNIGMQLGLARTVAADGVQMNPLPHHVVGEDGRELLVRRAGRDYLRPGHRFLRGRADLHVEARGTKVLRRLPCGTCIDVI